MLYFSCNVSSDDDVQAAATSLMRAGVFNPSALADRQNLRQVKKCLQKGGLQNKKTVILHEIAKKILVEHGGLVPAAMTDLSGMDGVGDKVASIMRTEVMHYNDGVGVDIHVKRFVAVNDWLPRMPAADGEVEDGATPQELIAGKGRNIAGSTIHQLNEEELRKGLSLWLDSTEEHRFNIEIAGLGQMLRDAQLRTTIIAELDSEDLQVTAVARVELKGMIGALLLLYR
jgi:hypothetical protein